MIMSEAVKLSLTQYFGERSEFRPHDFRALLPEQVREVEDPYARGLADGQQMAEAAFSIERDQLHNLLSSADALRPENNAEIAFLLESIIRSIVTKIIGSMPFDSAFLMQQIDAATTLLTEADRNRKLRLHPADLALLQNVELHLPCTADDRLPRGTIRIECSDGWVEHGPAFALDRLEQLLANDGGLA